MDSVSVYICGSRTKKAKLQFLKICIRFQALLESILKSFYLFKKKKNQSAALTLTAEILNPYEPTGTLRYRFISRPSDRH